MVILLAISALLFLGIFSKIILSPRDEIVVIAGGCVWFGYLIFIWLRSRKYIKFVEVLNDSLKIILQSGHEILLSLGEIQEVRVKNYIGFEEAIIKTKDGRQVRFTSHMSNYDNFLMAIGPPRKKDVKTPYKKFIHFLLPLWVFSTLLVILSIVLANFKGGETAMSLYSGSFLLILFCIVVTCLFLIIRKSNRKPHV